MQSPSSSTLSEEKLIQVSCFLYHSYFDLVWNEGRLLRSIWKIIMLVVRRQCFVSLLLHPVVPSQGSSSRKRDAFVRIYLDGVLLMSYRKVYLILNTFYKSLPLCIEITNLKCGFPFSELATKCLDSSLL